MPLLDVRTEVAGTVWKIESAVGDTIKKEGVILILESMKMEIPVLAPQAGKIEEICVKENELLEEDQLVARIKPTLSK